MLLFGHTGNSFKIGTLFCKLWLLLNVPPYAKVCDMEYITEKILGRLLSSILGAKRNSLLLETKMVSTCFIQLLGWG